MRFKRLDIVTSAPHYSPDVFVIVGIHPERPKNCYDGVSLKSGTQYSVGDASLALKRVGMADESYLTSPSEPSPDGSGASPLGAGVLDHNFLKGQRRAQRELAEMMFGTHSAQDKQRWEKLASLKPGDPFKVNFKGKVQTFTFRYVCAQGYKYVFVAENAKGTRYKYPLTIIAVESAKV